MITQREVVSQKVCDELTERASQFGVILDDISIVSALPGGGSVSVLQWERMRSDFPMWRYLKQQLAGRKMTRLKGSANLHKERFCKLALGFL